MIIIILLLLLLLLLIIINTTAADLDVEQFLPLPRGRHLPHPRQHPQRQLHHLRHTAA
jgi:hypothetical protein